MSLPVSLSNGLRFDRIHARWADHDMVDVGFVRSFQRWNVMKNREALAFKVSQYKRDRSLAVQACMEAIDYRLDFTIGYIAPQGCEDLTSHDHRQD